MKFKCTQGFTLVEMAIVLTIVGLLLSGGMSLLSTSSDTARYKETQNEMYEIKEALTNYFIQRNGVLPCPDIDNNTANASFGQSDYVSGNATTGGVCVNYQGWLPHVTLGIGGNGDAWGERYKYVVSKAFTQVTDSNPADGKLDMCVSVAGEEVYSRKPANAWRITIHDLTDATAASPATPTGGRLGDWAAFSLISTGKNGRLANAAINAGTTGAFSGCGVLDSREQYHCIGITPSTAQPFLLRSGNQLTDGNSVTFDDMVVWVGDVQLTGQLMKAGGCLGVNAPPPVSGGEETTTPPADSGGCSVARSGNDVGLVVLLAVSVIGLWLRSLMRA